MSSSGMLWQIALKFMCRLSTQDMGGNQDDWQIELQTQVHTVHDYKLSNEPLFEALLTHLHMLEKAGMVRDLPLGSPSVLQRVYSTLHYSIVQYSTVQYSTVPAEGVLAPGLQTQAVEPLHQRVIHRAPVGKQERVPGSNKHLVSCSWSHSNHVILGDVCHQISNI